MYIEHTDIMFKKKKKNKTIFFKTATKTKKTKILVAMLWQEGPLFGSTESKEHPWPWDQAPDFQLLLPSFLQHLWS